MSNHTRSYPNISRLAHVALISVVIAAVLSGITLLFPNPATLLIAKFVSSVAFGLALAGLALAIAFHEKD